MKAKIILFVILLLMVNIILLAQTPEWEWAIQATGSGWDGAESITLDNTGNTYIIGSFEQTTTFGSYSITSDGSSDIFVAKMDTNGNWLWATKAGGVDWDQGRGITIDDLGYVYVTGWFEETATFGPYSITSDGERDIFVARIDSNGNWLWATQAGGVNWDGGYSITLGFAENIYITGFFSEIATFGSFSLTSNGDDDVFVARIDSDGNWLWATKAGGIDSDEGRGMTIDDLGNTYITGGFEETATFGSFSLTSNGDDDIFVARIDSNGNWLWATQAGGNDRDFGLGITIDNIGNTYITGAFQGTATFGPTTLTSNGEFDIFIAKMDINGNWLWATQAGGVNWDGGYSITLGFAENIYITGFFSEIATFGSYSFTSYDEEADIFVAKMDTEGNWLWVTQAGETGHDSGRSIVIDNTGNSIITGTFDGVAIFGDFILNCTDGDNDIFVAKLGYDTSIENNEINSLRNELTNFPNPFNPSTTISFSILNDSNVELSIYNIKGQKIKTLINNEFTKGDHSIIWNGDDDDNKPVSSGVYLYKLKVNDKMEAVRKCILLK